jgi:hypothetical protein
MTGRKWIGSGHIQRDQAVTFAGLCTSPTTGGKSEGIR